MADLQATYTMPTVPAISHTVTAESKRSGSTVYYRLKIVTAPITSPSYFGYNLQCTAVIAGSTVASNAVIKGNSPSTWSSEIVTYLPSETGWYSVTGVTSATTVSASMTFSSNSGNSVSTGSRTLTVPAGTAPSGVKIALSATEGLKNTSITVTASVTSWGDSGAGKYTFYYGKDGEGFKTITTSSKSISFTPSSYGYTDGDTVNFMVQATNAGGLSSTAGVVRYVCVSPPDSPTNIQITPSSGTADTALTLSWTGSAVGWEIRLRYSSDNSTWSSWSTIATATTQELIFKTGDYISNDTGTVQLSVRAKNAYGQYSDWSDSAVYTLVSDNVSNTYIKINGSWQKAKSVYIKIDGAWKKASKVHIKNTTWKTK